MLSFTYLNFHSLNLFLSRSVSLPLPLYRSMLYLLYVSISIDLFSGPYFLISKRKADLTNKKHIVKTIQKRAISKYKDESFLISSLYPFFSFFTLLHLVLYDPTFTYFFYSLCFFFLSSYISTSYFASNTSTAFL